MRSQSAWRVVLGRLGVLLELIPQHGLAVQVDPVKLKLKPMLKPPGTERLKVKCGILLSNYAFKFDLRRYSTGWPRPTTTGR